MIHLIFNRPTGKMKVFEPDRSLWDVIDGGGDAWGDGVDADRPYGYKWPCPPGHYILDVPQSITPPIPSEGSWQIPVLDMPSSDVTTLLAAHDASQQGSNLSVGGVALPLGQLAYYGRSAIMIHGGGSNLQNPYADYQELCKTEGCTRLHNADLARLARYLLANADGNTVVYSIVGDPLPLSR